MDLLKRTAKWLDDNEIFQRERKSDEQRALGMLLYNADLVIKNGYFVNASYEAIREWYQKGKEIFDQSIEVIKRKHIAVDEKVLKINGKGCSKSWNNACYAQNSMGIP